jgi:hypothetical protein
MADLLPNQPHIYDVAPHTTLRPPLACCERLQFIKGVSLRYTKEYI